MSEPTMTRLAKLVPRLASEHEGEVVATVRAMARVLSSGGLDWHDVARALRTSAPRGAETGRQEPEQRAPRVTPIDMLIWLVTPAQFSRLSLNEQYSLRIAADLYKRDLRFPPKYTTLVLRLYRQLNGPM